MRVCALRLVCDSPLDVEEELCSSLCQVVSVTRSAPTSDVSGLLQSLEQRVQALANTSDPLSLGFSAGSAGELVKVHSRTLNTLLQDSQKPFGRAEWDGRVVSSLHFELNQSTRNSKPTISSLLTLSSLFRLERRAVLLKAYPCDEATSGPSNAYRLSAFSNARGFQGTLIREAANAKQRDISNIFP
ncbi:unnamed protein product [Coregonus sp. 'balchen']|nr:unnamed protein product [Coregonus sp. 'balchen']